MTSPRNRGCVVARCASARPDEIVLPVPDGRGVDAGADDLQRCHLALAAEQDRVVVERSGERHPHRLAGARVQGDVRVRALERAQLADCLLGDQSAGAGRQAVGGGDRQHPGAALHPPDPDGVLEVAGGFG